MKAIVEGEPPRLPSDHYSSVAQDFVRACVNKIPSKRHTYPMLLTHPWLKALAKPETIDEDAEGEEAAAHGHDLADAAGKLNLGGIDGDGVYDWEVAEWVRRSLERKSAGHADQGQANQETLRPALHAAPLDGLSPLSSQADGVQKDW